MPVDRSTWVVVRRGLREDVNTYKLGSDLRGGERKSGTNRFEAYITAQCVNSKSRLILAALYMDKSSSVHESLRKTINLCLENASAVGSRLGLILVDRGFFSV